ncbi:Glucose-inhibited division family A protein isoform 1 [Hibiscus syriacus]|uniref:Glucose-inhibited division family A protein isoform 1 n=1 Tax=Hibiscus syriacus TaxID=106335 RepID=A0A6A3D574_HIBSY|nr:uncharacterized protein LOC120174961 [Hibiscus syriacus]KAE8735807.1 Glucose-inhibited division family A protein isoform 1 [Hibiscus syriacus]
MPEPDLGRIYIWTISGILFVCVAIGAGCLLVYMTSPRSPSSDFLPILGFFLVCMPWLFWIITIVYRIMSRAFGFRMVAGNLYGNSSTTTKSAGNGSTGSSGDGGGGATVGNNDIDGAEIRDAGAEPQPNSPKKGEAKNDGQGIKKGNRPSSTGSNDVSINSHESEMPLSS